MITTKNIDCNELFQTFQKNKKTSHVQQMRVGAMTRSPPGAVHGVMSVLLLTVALIKTVWIIACRTAFARPSQDVNRVLDTIRATDGREIIFSSKYNTYNIEVSDRLERYTHEQEHVFWFFIVGIILLTSRSLVFAFCAFKLSCCKGIRSEIIQTLEDFDDTRDQEHKEISAIDK